MSPLGFEAWLRGAVPGIRRELATAVPEGPAPNRASSVAPWDPVRPRQSSRCTCQRAGMPTVLLTAGGLKDGKMAGSDLAHSRATQHIPPLLWAEAAIRALSRCQPRTTQKLQPLGSRAVALFSLIPASRNGATSLGREGVRLGDLGCPGATGGYRKQICTRLLDCLRVKEVSERWPIDL